MNQVVSFKVHLRNTQECRRFSIDDPSVITSFLFMKEKLKTLFPNLHNVPFKITWLDNDNDHITISCDDDLILAFTEMPQMKVLYITVMDQQVDGPALFSWSAPEAMQTAPEVHPGVVCDVCEDAVTGFRYKCAFCPDYDLCAACEAQGHHSEHVMMRLPNGDLPKYTRKLMCYLGKSLKKAAASTSKEAYRAGKHCAKLYAREHAAAAAAAAAGPSAAASAATSGHRGRGHHHGRHGPCRTEFANFFDNSRLADMLSMSMPYLEDALRHCERATNAVNEQNKVKNNGNPVSAPSNANNKATETTETGNQANVDATNGNGGGNIPGASMSMMQSMNGNSASAGSYASASEQPPVFPEAFGNLVQTAISSFFRLGIPQQGNHQPTANSDQNVNTTPVEQTSPRNSTPPNEASSIPMDVETNSQTGLYPLLTPQSVPVPSPAAMNPNAPAAAEAVAAAAAAEKLPEPGWTFVNTSASKSAPSAPLATPNTRPKYSEDQKLDTKIAEGLNQLLEMGFSDELDLVSLLKRFDGNVGHVVKFVFENDYLDK